MVCPHAAIRVKAFQPALLAQAPPTFKSMTYKGAEMKGMSYTVQVAPEDCTGCGVCVAVCPGKDKANPKHRSLDMQPQMPLRESERANYDFFLALPESRSHGRQARTSRACSSSSRSSSISGACAGCGETPYVKLMTQLFGDRMLIANATGCSSIYGGNLPTTPYTKNSDGRGPAWNNSLFEDNAEFGFGYRLAVDQHERPCAPHAHGHRPRALAPTLVDELLKADQSNEAGIAAQRARVVTLKQKLAGIAKPEARRLENAGRLPGEEERVDRRWRRLGLRYRLRRPRSRAWRWDATSTSWSSTPRSTRTPAARQSKATPIGAAAKFAAAGKSVPKKDLGMMAMAYGNVYVAHVAFGAKDTQTVTGLPGGGFVSGNVDHHRLLAVHRAWLRPGQRPAAADSSPSTPATGRFIATIQGAAAAARARSSSTQVPPRATWSSSCATRRASAWSSAATPSASIIWSRRRRPNWPAASPSTSSSLGQEHRS